HVAKTIIGQTAASASVSSEEIDQLNLDERLSYVVKKAIQMNSLPQGIDESYYRSGIDIQAAHTTAILRYQPKIYPGRITLLRVKDDRPAARGWRSIAKGGIDIEYVPGTHSDIVHQPHVREFAAHLKRYINQAIAS